MTIRSRPLLGLAISLLTAAAALGAVLQHDGEVGTTAVTVASMEPGDDVRFKGVAEPFVTPPESRLPAALMAMLDNATYIVTDPAVAAEGVLLLVTDEEPHLETDSVVVDGEVLFSGSHPDRSGRTLVIVAAHDWTTPILFR